MDKKLESELEILKLGYQEQRRELRRAVNAFQFSSGFLLFIGMLVYTDFFSAHREKALLGFLWLTLIWFSYGVFYHFERRQIRRSLYLFENLINQLVKSPSLFMESGFYKIISDLKLQGEEFDTGQTIRNLHKVMGFLFFIFLFLSAISLLSEGNLVFMLLVLLFLGIVCMWMILLVRNMEKKIDWHSERLFENIQTQFNAKRKSIK